MGVEDSRVARLLQLSKSSMLVLQNVCDNDGGLELEFQFMLCDHKLMDDFPSTQLHFLNTRDIAKLMRQMWLGGWIQIKPPSHKQSVNKLEQRDLTERLFCDLVHSPESAIDLAREWRYDITEVGLDVWDSIFLHNIVSGISFVKCPANRDKFSSHYLLLSQCRDRLTAMTSVLVDDCDAEIIVPVSKLQFDHAIKLSDLEMPGPWHCEIMLKKSFSTTLPFAIHLGLYHRNDASDSWTIPQLPGTFLSRVAYFQLEMDKIVVEERR